MMKTMATQTITQVTDDLDGSKNAEPVSFAYDGVTYTIDLSTKNKTALSKLLKPYIDAGHKVSGRTTKSPRRSAGRTDLAAVREWAKSNGYTVSERGRVAADVIGGYDAR
jgi:hypothetical protein